MQTQSIQLSYSSLNKRKSHKGLFVGIAIIIVLVLILVIMIALLVVDNKRKDNHNYGVVFEAGMKKTTAYVYKWDKKHKSIDTLDFHEVEYLRDLTKNVSRSVVGNVSTLVGKRYDKVENYFEELIEFVNCFVPGWAKGSTPIYVRLLKESGVTSRDHDLISNITKVVSSSGFKVADRCVECVSEEEQHACVWLAMNYLRGVVYRDDTRKSPCGGYGIFCLTNHSNAVIFRPNNTEVKKYKHNITLGKTRYDIYDYSSTEYGKERAFERVLNLTLEKSLHNNNNDGDDDDNNNNNVTVYFPCYMKDYNTTHGDNVLIRGTGNVTECIDLISEVLNTNATCEEKGESCSINGVYMPDISSGYDKFFALDDFYTIANFLSVSTGIPTKLDTLRKNTGIYCNISFTHYNETKWNLGEHIARYCFWGAYSYSVLHAYGPEDDTVIFANNVEGVSFNYPYGAMLTEINIKQK